MPEHPDWLIELEELAAEIAAKYPEPASWMRCAECGASDDGRRGWTMRLDAGGELVAFCPECDVREFGDA